MSDEKKEAMKLEDCPVIEVRVPVYLTFDPDREDNPKITSVTGLTIVGDDGLVKGFVMDVLGGGQLARIRRPDGSKEEWFINPEDAFNKIEGAVKRYWKKEEKK